MRILLPHPHQQDRLDYIKSEMRRLGRPEIIVYLASNDLCIALEGVHRLTAASQLSLEPLLVYLDEDQAEDRLYAYIESAPRWAIVRNVVRGIRTAYKVNDQYPCLVFEACQLRPAQPI